jgi:hypothetical protein
MVIPATCRALMSIRALGGAYMTKVEIEDALDAMIGVLEAWAAGSSYAGALKRLGGFIDVG